MAMEMPFNISNIGDFGNIFQMLMQMMGQNIPQVGGTPTSTEEKTRWEQQNQGSKQFQTGAAMNMLAPLMSMFSQMGLMQEDARLKQKSASDMGTLFAPHSSNAGLYGSSPMTKTLFNPMASGGNPYKMNPNFGSFGEGWGGEMQSRQSDTLKDLWGYQSHMIGKIQKEGPYRSWQAIQDEKIDKRNKILPWQGPYQSYSYTNPSRKGASSW